MDRRKLALLVTVILAVGFLYRGLHKTPITHAEISEPPRAERSAPAKEVAAPAPGMYSSYTMRDLEAAHDQQDLGTMAPTERRGFVRRLKMFRKYSRKVLKTEAEARLLHTLIADDATQTQAIGALNAATDENERMVIVDYLLAGLEEQKSLGRNSLRDKVAGFLQTEVSRDLSKQQIKSLAADRIELFAALQQVDPRATEQLMASAKSELNKRIYQYAIVNYGKKGS